MTNNNDNLHPESPERRELLRQGAFNEDFLAAELVHDLEPIALQRRMIAENAISNVVELDTDHTPHLSMPGPLANALQQFAHHATSAR